MPTLSITRSVVNGTVFTQAQNETQCSDVETWANTTKLDSTNIQTGGIATANLAAAAVTNAKLATSAVDTANIVDAAVTGIKLNANVVDNSSLQLASNQLAVKAGGVTQAMLAARASANPAPAGGVAVGSGTGGGYSNSTTTLTTVDSATLTTTGRPVIIALVSSVASQAVNPSAITCTYATGLLDFFRDTTWINAEYTYSAGASGVNPQGSGMPLAIDFPAAGTYTYAVKGKVAFVNDVTSKIQVVGYKLIAFEL